MDSATFPVGLQHNWQEIPSSLLRRAVLYLINVEYHGRRVSPPLCPDSVHSSTTELTTMCLYVAGIFHSSPVNMTLTCPTLKWVGVQLFACLFVYCFPVWLIGWLVLSLSLLSPACPYRTPPGTFCRISFHLTKFFWILSHFKVSVWAFQYATSCFLFSILKRSNWARSSKT